MSDDDKLRLMWEQQREFMKLLISKRGFPEFPLDTSKKTDQKFIKDIIHDTMDELWEASYLLKNSKMHRKTDMGEIDRDHFVEELCDSLHFFFEVCLLSGVTIDELYDVYMRKGEVNTNKILNGY